MGKHSPSIPLDSAPEGDCLLVGLRAPKVIGASRTVILGVPDGSQVWRTAHRQVLVSAADPIYQRLLPSVRCNWDRIWPVANALSVDVSCRSALSRRRERRRLLPSPVMRYKDR